MEIKKSKVYFSTGKEKYANLGIIGIDPKLNVYEGYDGHFYYPEFDDVELYGENISPEERIELADHMIALWNTFKQKANDDIC